MFHKVLQSCAVWSIYIDPLGGEGKVERILVTERERADGFARAGAPQLQCICVVVTTVVPVVLKEHDTTPS